MSKQVQVALLAIAALTSIAIAGARITHAARSSPPERSLLPAYASTPAGEAATFAALRVPAGFHRSHDCLDIGQCYLRNKQLPLNAQTARRVTEAFGVSPISGRGQVMCGGWDCQVKGRIGSEHVSVSLSNRPLVKTHERRTRQNRRAFRPFRLLHTTKVGVSWSATAFIRRSAKKRQRSTPSRASRQALRGRWQPLSAEKSAPAQR